MTPLKSTEELVVSHIKAKSNTGSRGGLILGCKVTCGRDRGRPCVMFRNTCWEIRFLHGLQIALTIFLPVTKEEGVGEGSRVSVDHNCGKQQRSKK